MQLARDPLALFLLTHDEAARERAIELERSLLLGHVTDDADHAAVVGWHEARLEIAEFVPIGSS